MFETLPGFREFFPKDCLLRNHIFRIWRQTALRFSFQEYDTPVLEPLELYRAKSGDEIVSQLFNFEDRGGREVALRPETTPGLARMVGGRAQSLKRPVKWFSIGEQYRYERPQRGRLRAFYQFNADILGEEGPAAETELISLLISMLRAFGLEKQDFYVRLSDRDLWTLYLRGLGLATDTCEQVLTIIDKRGREKEETIREKLTGLAGDKATVLLEALDLLPGMRTLPELRAFADGVRMPPEIKEAFATRLNDWEALLGDLEAMGWKEYVEIDLGVVRGLAYYTGFVFEAFDRAAEFRALAGGGRYNDLVRKMSGTDFPAVGFGMGDVVLEEILGEKNLLPEYVTAPDIYVVYGAGESRSVALSCVQQMRDNGFRVEYAFRPLSFGRQFRAAGQSGARFAVICGEEEVSRRTLKIRDLQSRNEEDVPMEQLIVYLRTLL